MININPETMEHGQKEPIAITFDLTMNKIIESKFSRIGHTVKVTHFLKSFA